MSLYDDMTTKPSPVEPRPRRKFIYRTYPDAPEREISAHEIYIYDAGRIGFWDDDGDERVLVLGTKAFDVREIVTKGES